MSNTNYLYKAELDMDRAQLIGKFQQTMADLNTSRFVSDVAEYYQGESAMLSCIESLESRGTLPTPSLISERLNVSRGTVTATLRALERKGLARTRLMKNDRRRVEVKLTDSGRVKAQTKRDRVERWCAMLIDQLGEHQFSLLVELIDKAIAQMGYEEEKNV
jgi:DNA-binding MarR family transcriptional regulator